MLNSSGGFHVRALDPASADDLRARVAGDGGGDHDSNSRRSDGSGTAVTGETSAGGGGGGRSKPWVGPEWRRGKPQEKRKIQLVQALPPAAAADDDGSSDRQCDVTNRDAATCEAVVGGPGYGFDEHESAVGDCGEDPARLPALATTARGGPMRRKSADTKADVREGEGGGGSWGYKTNGLGNILAFVARRRHTGGSDRG